MRILVADDHDFTRSITVRLLREVGHAEVAEAHDGASALDAARGARPDVVISDLNMPGMDGMTFIRHLAKEKLTDSLIVLSGLTPSVLSAVESMATVSGLRVLGAVRKPIKKEALAALLHLHANPPTSVGSAANIDLQSVERGLALGEFAAWHAPVIELPERRAVAALLHPRWNSKVFGTLMGADALGPVDTVGAAASVSRRIARSGMSDCAHWRQLGWQGSVVVPLSLGALTDDALLDELAAQVKINQLSAGAFRVAIEGGAFREDPATASFAVARALMLSFGVLINLRVPADLEATNAVASCGTVMCPASWIDTEPAAMKWAHEFARRTQATFGVTGVVSPEALDALAAAEVKLAEGPGVGAPAPAAEAFSAHFASAR